MPHLVVEWVVKYKDLPVSPAQEPVGHTQLGPLNQTISVRYLGLRRYFQAKMNSEPSVGGASVSPDVSASVHHAEFGL